MYVPQKSLHAPNTFLAPQPTPGDTSSLSDAHARRYALPMALSAPWLADCLVTALQVYLPPHTETHLFDCPFVFSNDNSNLFVLVKSISNRTVYILEWRLSQSGKVVVAEVTDGEIQVKTTFRISDLDSESLSLTKPSQLALGTTLQPSEIELRLADCFEPPRFTLHLKKFTILKNVSKIVASNLLTIHDHRLASEYIDKWKRQEEAWRMDSSPSSPVGIRSQAADGSEMSGKSDAEDQDPLSTSQVRFATQLPLRRSPKEPKPHVLLRPPASEGKRGASDLDLPKESSHAQLLKRAPQSGTSLPKEDDIESTGGDLTQQQLVAPSSNRPAQQNEGSVQRQVIGNVDPLPDKGIQFSNSEYMPKALVQLFRNLREECQNGRHVPRRLQVIPKDQARLLESDDSWQPPLVGRVQRSGTVPLDLLNYITEEADSVEHQQELDRQTSNLAPDDIRLAACNGSKKQGPEQGSSHSSEDRTDCSEPVEWSSSPPPPQRPLDSSPPGLYGQKGTSAPQEEAHLSQHNEESSMSPRLPDLSVLPSSSPKQSNTPVRSKNTAKVPRDTNGLSSVRSKAPKKIVPNLVDSASSSRSKSITAPCQKTVQVKRTPFPIKDAQSPCEVPESSGNVIPGTFDERCMSPNNKVLEEVVNSASDTTPSTLSKVNGTLTEGQLPRNATSVPGGGVLVASKPSASQAHRDHTSDQGKLRGRKRKSVDGQMEHSKRSRTSEVKIDCNNVERSSYQIIDEERAKYRRNFLSKISHKDDFIEKVLSSIQVPNDADESEDSRAPVQLNRLLGSSPLASLQKPVETSDIHLSAHAGYKHRTYGEGVAGSVSVTSAANNSPTIALYPRFRAAYPLYGGKRQHFDAACQLLRRLQSQGKATHPSLWDDFIFRHHHDYRDHLLEVMETSGSALPYERFYEECIEQPTHLQRIVKPSHITSLPIDLASNLRASFATSVNDAQTEPSYSAKGPTSLPLAKSTMTDSSTGKVVPAEQSLNLDRLVKPSADTQVDKVRQQGLHVEEPGDDAAQRQNHSQESRRSIKLWLEKSSGAESPILGTPQEEPVDSANTLIPELTLDAIDEPVPSAAAKRKQLPWSRSIPHDQDETPRESINTTSAQPKPGLTPKSQSTNRPGKAIGVEVQERQVVTPPVAPVTFGGHLQSSHLRPETTFQRFAKFYNDIPKEKSALRSGESSGTKRLVDIFSWRD